MTTDNDIRGSVLVLGRSQLVLDDIVAGLRELGYVARATNEFFGGLTGRFDPNEIDLVVFGGQVPPDRKAELTEEMGAANPRIIFVQGLAGIAGLIINQIQGAFAADRQRRTQAPAYVPDGRVIRLTLAEPAEVKVTVWWTTSIVPPDPKSDSLIARVRDRTGRCGHPRVQRRGCDRLTRHHPATRPQRRERLSSKQIAARRPL